MQIVVAAQQFYEYSTYIRGYTKLTVRRYRHAIGFFVRHVNVTHIDEVSNKSIRDFLYYGRIERQWTPITFHGYYKSLKVFFRWCVKEGYIAVNPVDDIEAPKLENRIPTKLTRQEAMLLLEVAYNYPYQFSFLRYRNHAIFSTFLFAGLRKSELLNLKFTDVDVENLTIMVRQGKGNKDRILPMSHTIAESLKRYLSARKRANKTCPEFFCSLNRNVGFTSIGINRLMYKMREVTGISFTLHKLRHTFATLMLEGGCDIYSLSKMMGHSDIKTTTIYLYASPEHLRSQIGKHPLNGVA